MTNIKNIEAFIQDVDGTLHEGGRPRKGSIEFIGHLNENIFSLIICDTEVYQSQWFHSPGWCIREYDGILSSMDSSISPPLNLLVINLSEKYEHDNKNQELSSLRSQLE